MFGSLFLDLPTMIFPYIQKSPQKFIVTLKNPTDRLIAEYFYPYSQVTGSSAGINIPSYLIDNSCLYYTFLPPTCKEIREQ